MTASIYMSREQAIANLWKAIESTCEPYRYSSYCYHEADAIMAVFNLEYWHHAARERSTYDNLLDEQTLRQPDGIITYTANLFTLHLLVLAAEGELE